MLRYASFNKFVYANLIVVILAKTSSLGFINDVQEAENEAKSKSLENK